NGPANDIRTATFAGGYSPRSVRITGTLNKLASSTFRSESRVYVVAPAAAVFEPQLALQTSYTRPSVTTKDLVLPIPTPISNAIGTWTFRFYERADDAGVDANWNPITFTLDDALPAGLTTLTGSGGVYTEAEPNDNTFPNNSTNTSTTTGTGSIYGG